MGNPTTPPLYEQWHNGSFLVSEANGHRSRDRILLTGGAVIYAGTVLAKQADGRYVQINPAATDGTQNAAAILFGTTDVTTVDKHATAVIRSCEVNASELVWPAAATAAQIAAATAQLTALGIISR